MSPRPIIHIYSFSYHETGIPPDPTGHGGGFVFDCRFLPNPGREERYRDRTGRDPEISSYLESLPEAELFWRRLSGIVEDGAKAFRAKEYDHMTVAFGCTGGRHRSVYFAERLWRHLTGRGEKCTLDHLALPKEGGA